jgi:putative endonuclease
MPCVYILKSLKNSRYYIGSTIDLKRRLIEHNSGSSKYTSLTRPFELVFSQDFDNIKVARRIELKLKRLKSRRIIDRIISDKYIKLKDD